MRLASQHLADSVFAGSFIAVFDTRPTLVDAIGREERAIADIGHQAQLTRDRSRERCKSWKRRGTWRWWRC